MVCAEVRPIWALLALVAVGCVDASQGGERYGYCSPSGTCADEKFGCVTSEAATMTAVPGRVCSIDCMVDSVCKPAADGTAAVCGQRVCRRSCDPQRPACPTDFECVTAGASSPFCAPTKARPYENCGSGVNGRSCLGGTTCQVPAYLEKQTGPTNTFCTRDCDTVADCASSALATTPASCLHFVGRTKGQCFASCVAAGDACPVGTVCGALGLEIDNASGAKAQACFF